MGQDGKCSKRQGRKTYSKAIEKRNKVRKLTKRVKKFPQDLQAAEDLKRWRAAAV